MDDSQNQTVRVLLDLTITLLKEGAAEDSEEKQLIADVLATLSAAIQHGRMESLAQEVERWSESHLGWQSYDESSI
jgi:hypothetical protein